MNNYPFNRKKILKAVDKTLLEAGVIQLTDGQGITANQLYLAAVYSVDESLCEFRIYTQQEDVNQEVNQSQDRQSSVFVSNYSLDFLNDLFNSMKTIESDDQVGFLVGMKFYEVLSNHFSKEKADAIYNGTHNNIQSKSLKLFRGLSYQRAKPLEHQGNKSDYTEASRLLSEDCQQKGYNTFTR